MTPINKIKNGDIFKHKKTGTTYRVINVNMVKKTLFLVPTKKDYIRLGDGGTLHIKKINDLFLKVE